MLEAIWYKAGKPDKAGGPLLGSAYLQYLTLVGIDIASNRKRKERTGIFALVGFRLPIRKRTVPLKKRTGVRFWVQVQRWCARQWWPQ